MSGRKRPGIYPRQNADGSWSYQIRWKQGGGRNGKQSTHTFDRERVAVDALNRIKAARNVCHCPEHAPPGVTPTKHHGAPGRPAVQVTPAGGPRFGEFAARHVEALTGVGPGYRAQFRRELARHFGPFLDRPLDQIGDLDVREWIRGCEQGSHPWLVRRVPGSSTEYRSAPLSPVTVRRLLVQAGSVMAAAVDEGIVTRNPFRRQRVGRRDRDQHTEMVVLTPDEWAVLESALPEGTWRDLGSLLVGTGLRFGEATALTVGHVEPLASPPRLRVAQAWQNDGASGYQLGTPKSVRSRRVVTLSGAVLDAVLPHRSGKRDDELLFTTPTGAPVRHSNFYHRVWLPALAQAGAAGLGKRPRIHDLRHTHVSWLVAAGLDVGAISKRLGHESITTTIDRYHHLLPQVDTDALAALDRALPRRPPLGD